MCSVNVRNNRMIKFNELYLDSENDSASSFFIRMFDITVSIFLQVKIKTLNINNFFLNNDIVMKFSTRVS